MEFIKNNWAWILLPIVLFAAVVIAIIVMTSGPMDQHAYLIR